MMINCIIRLLNCGLVCCFFYFKDGCGVIVEFIDEGCDWVDGVLVVLLEFEGCLFDLMDV